MSARIVGLAAAVVGFVWANLAGAAPAQSAPPAQPGPQAQAAAPSPPSVPLRFVARYDLRVTVDANRNSPAAAKVKAAKGAMALLGGSVAAGMIEDVVDIAAEKYTVSSSGKANRAIAALIGGDTLSRRSEGAVGGGYLASQKFIEARGAKTRLAVNTDYPKRVATYFKNGKQTKVEAVTFRIADSASIPYLFLRQPLPSAPITIAATDGRATRQIYLNPLDEVLQIGKHQVAVVHLARDQRQHDEAAVDLWLRKDDGMPLMLRLGLVDKYGVVLEQKLRELPPVMN